MEGEKRTREYGIDVARGIAIFLVVIGHTSAPLSLPNNFAFSVHLTLFFVLSGYLMRPERYAFWEYVKKRAFRLLLPYFLFALTSAIKNIQNFPLQLASALFCSGKINSVLPLLPDQPWFLPCLFLSELVFFGVRKLERFSFGKWVEVPLCLLLSACGFLLTRIHYLPWSIDIALFVQIFLCAGMLLKRSGLLQTAVFLRGALCALFAALWIFAVVYATQTGQAISYVLSLNERNIALPSLVLSCFGSFSVLLFSSLLGQVGYLRAPFAYLGKISIVVYLFHLSGFDFSLLVQGWVWNALLRIAYCCLLAEFFRLLPFVRDIYGLPPRFSWRELWARLQA
ncbi:MAG: acyltransferase family protein [Clostridia bacterium]|nr:acyltransferase family protein [Clostridia bacterium]